MVRFRNILIVIIALGNFVANSQPSDFRDYKVRRWHVEFDWTAESGAVGYEMYMNDSFHGTVTGTTYVAANLDENTNYFFKVRSVFSGGTKSPFSYTINVRTGLYPAERTTFSTIPYAAPTYPGNGNRPETTNEFGLFQKPITNDTGFPRGNNKDFWDYPKIAAFTPDNQFIKTAQSSGIRFYKISDFNFDSERNIGRYISMNPNFPSRSYASRNDRTFRIYDNTTQIFSREFTEFNSSSYLLPTAEDKGSWDGKLWVFSDTNGNPNRLIVYNAETNTIIKDFVQRLNPLNGWAAISPLGNYLVVYKEGETPRELDVYRIESNDVVFERTITHHNLGHSDFQVSMQGNEVLVQRANGVILMTRLHDGAKIPLMGAETNPNFISLGHASGVNALQPGWMYINNNSESIHGVDGQSRRSYRKVFALKLDENTTGYGDTLIREYCVTMTPNSLGDMGIVVPSIDGTMLAVNQLNNGTRKVGSFLQQRNNIGDEIPFGSGPDCPPCEIGPDPDPDPEWPIRTSQNSQLPIKKLASIT